MAEYIKRETVINHLDACMDTIWKPEIAALKCFVEGIPAADVAPVRHGKWVHSRYENCSEQFEMVKCSCCGREAYAMAFYVRGGNYCPNCGAKMDGWRVDGEEND